MRLQNTHFIQTTAKELQLSPPPISELLDFPRSTDKAVPTDVPVEYAAVGEDGVVPGADEVELGDRGGVVAARLPHDDQVAGTERPARRGITRTRTTHLQNKTFLVNNQNIRDLVFLPYPETHTD